jgi:hypothetical protein
MVLLRWMHLRKLVPLAELIEQMGGGGGVSRPPSRPAPPAPSAKPAIAPPKSAAPAPAPVRSTAPPAPANNFKDAFLAEVRSGKGFFYNTVVAQAQKIEVTPDVVTFSFLPNQRALREQCEQARPWLEQVAERMAGRKVIVTAVQMDAPAAAPADAPRKAADQGSKRDLKAEAMSSTAVQAMLDVFPATIRDVEEM